MRNLFCFANILLLFLGVYSQVKTSQNSELLSKTMAKLADCIVYAEVSKNRKFERDEIYFYDLGNAFGKKYEKLDAINGYMIPIIKFIFLQKIKAYSLI